MIDLTIVSIVLSSVSTTAIAGFAVLKNIERFKCCICCESECKKDNISDKGKTSPINQQTKPIHIDLGSLQSLPTIVAPPPSPVHLQQTKPQILFVHSQSNESNSTRSSPNSISPITSPRVQHKLPHIQIKESPLHNK